MYFSPGWCLTPTLLLICSSFTRENGYPLLICSSLRTAQEFRGGYILEISPNLETFDPKIRQHPIGKPTHQQTATLRFGRLSQLFLDAMITYHMFPKKLWKTMSYKEMILFWRFLESERINILQNSLKPETINLHLSSRGTAWIFDSLSQRTMK